MYSELDKVEWQVGQRLSEKQRGGSVHAVAFLLCQYRSTVRGDLDIGKCENDRY